jgi:integrase
MSRERLQARDCNVQDVIRKGEKLSLEQWADFFLENYSNAEKTHQVNLRVAKHPKGAFASLKLVDITADDIELYLRDRLRKVVRIRSALGFQQMGVLKPTTIHQELRVLRRMLSVAVRKKLLQSNPCWGVEFLVAVRGMFRPHYVTWSEQRRIESYGSAHLRNIVQINTETGLRVYKELTPMKKDQVDLANATVWIPDSKTPNGIAEIPLTPLAVETFKSQMRSQGLDPSCSRATKTRPVITRLLRPLGRKALKRAGVPYFRIYDLRSTYATRLSAGGVADEWVTQLLRQGRPKSSKSKIADEARSLGEDEPPGQ